MKKQKSLWIVCLLIFSVTGCFSCAKMGSELDLEKRVAQYAQALNADDSETLYAMTAPSYRTEVSLKEFMLRRNIRYTDVSVQRIEKDDDRALEAHVFFSSTMNALGFDFSGHVFKTHWAIEDNEWFILPSRVSFKDTFSQTQE
ncbi:MAG: hypothetical protein EOM12_15635 [Verrucomicrobiae bacterium]|nr:hypothetical protein [Verrucomicrobiae bacterium]